MLRTMPTRSALAAPWFDGCLEGRLLIQQCSACRYHQFYPRILCTACGARDLAWVEASGEARIASFTVVRHAISEAYDAPYVVALVDLTEGPRLMTHIVDSAPEDVSIGARVRLRFEAWAEDVSLPVFTLVATSTPPQDNPRKEDAQS